MFYYFEKYSLSFEIDSSLQTNKFIFLGVFHDIFPGVSKTKYENIWHIV